MPLESFVVPKAAVRRHNPYASVSEVAAKPVEELEFDDEPFEAANTGLSDYGSDAECASNCTEAFPDADEAVVDAPEEHAAAMECEVVDNEDASYVPWVPLDMNYRSPLEGSYPVSACTKLFLGQLPYNMSPRNVLCLVEALSGCAIVRAEKIIRWTQRHRACGCFHIFCRPEDAATILATTDTALVYGQGFYVATDDAQRQRLRSFCEELRQHQRGSEAQPVNLVTVQEASSNYTRPQRMRPALRRQQQFEASPPPPYYAPYGYRYRM